MLRDYAEDEGMRYNQLGPSGLKVSEIFLGTMTWGEPGAPEDRLHRSVPDPWPGRDVPAFGKSLCDSQQERPAVPAEEQLAVFADLIKAGKIRHLGVSNETP